METWQPSGAVRISQRSEREGQGEECSGVMKFAGTQVCVCYFRGGCVLAVVARKRREEGGYGGERDERAPAAGWING